MLSAKDRAELVERLGRVGKALMEVEGMPLRALPGFVSACAAEFTLIEEEKRTIIFIMTKQ